VYAFAEIMTANRALHDAQVKIAQLASQAERSRIRRDLHDLLGHSLTAITVKAALARRLASSDQAGAVREIREVEELSRQALADVRAAVSNYQEVTLAGELARGRELLRATGVVAELPTATDVVDPSHDQLLGWAVREGITNVARHAQATRCTVTLGSATVEIADDGIGGAASCGNGLTGLRERVSATGGSVEAGPVSPRGWRLRVSLEPASTDPR
jgi:two-component system, NarL family, sensor histidine kinase DesK